MAEINPLYPITELTQEQYDNLEVKDENTLYAIPYSGILPKKKNSGEGKLECILMTQEDYDALQAKAENILYCIFNPPYDETKIAVVLLDGNYEPTDVIEYFDTIRSAQSYLYSADLSNRYLLYIGENAGITEIAQNALASTTTLRKVRMPDSVVSIGVAAFQDCSNLATIDGMNEISSIGNNVFDGCASLKSVNLPDSLITIGHGAFQYSGLTSIIIPDSVTSELYQICLGCTDLESATIGTSVSKIYTNAFKDCTSLTNVLIKDGVSEISNNSFYNCLSLTSISIPHSVSVMNTSPFAECTNLSQIIVDAKWGDVTPTYWYPPATTYCWGATNATITWTRGYPAIKIINGSSVVKYTDNIGEASNFVHNGYSGDRYYVEISGNTVTSVGGFANSQYLYGMSMNSDSITTIADGACYGCYNLAAVEIGASVSSIGNFSFANCTNLSTIKINQPENSISGAPWGAINATIVWTG